MNWICYQIMRIVFVSNGRICYQCVTSQILKGNRRHIIFSTVIQKLFSYCLFVLVLPHKESALLQEVEKKKK